MNKLINYLHILFCFHVFNWLVYVLLFDTILTFDYCLYIFVTKFVIRSKCVLDNQKLFVWNLNIWNKVKQIITVQPNRVPRPTMKGSWCWCRHFLTSTSLYSVPSSIKVVVTDCYVYSKVQSSCSSSSFLVLYQAVLGARINNTFTVCIKIEYKNHLLQSFSLNVYNFCF